MQGHDRYDSMISRRSYPTAIFLVIVSVYIGMLASMDIAEAVDGKLISAPEVGTGDQVDIDGVLYTVQLDHDGDMIRFQDGDDIWFLQEGGCKQLDDWTVCFDNALNADETKDPRAELSIYETIIEIVTDRHSDRKEASVADVFDIVTRINNTGTQFAEDVVLIEDLPGPATVLKSIGCDIQEENIRWQGDIQVNGSKACRYDLSIDRPGVYTTRAEVTYKRADQSISVLTDPLTLTVHHLVNMSIVDESSSLLPGNWTRINISVTNRHDDELNPDIILRVPEELDPSTTLRSPSQQGGDIVWQWSPRMDDAQTKDTWIRVTPNKAGVYPISVQAFYGYDIHTYATDQLVHFLEVDEPVIANETTSDNGTVELEINVTPNDPQQGEEINIGYVIRNKNKKISASGLRTYLSVDGRDVNSSSIPSLGAGQGRRIRTHHHTIAVNHTGELTIGVRYTGMFNGTLINGTKTETISVSDTPDLSVEASMDSDMYSVGEVGTRTVSVDNTKDVLLTNISVRDILPEGVAYLSGVKQRTMSMAEESNVTAYSYDFLVLDNYTNGSFVSEAIVGPPFSQRVNISDSLAINTTSIGVNVSIDSDRDDGWLGEIIPVTYTMTNKQRHPLKDVRLVIDADNVSGVAYDRFIDKELREGASTQVTIRVHATTAGNMTTPSGTLSFSSGQRRFHKALDGINLTIDDDRSDGPLPGIRVDGRHLIAEDRYVYSVTAHNDGDQHVDVMLSYLNETSQQTDRQTTHRSIIALKIGPSDVDKTTIRSSVAIGESLNANYSYAGYVFTTKPEISMVQVQPEQQAEQQESEDENREEESQPTGNSVAEVPEESVGLIVWILLGVAMVILIAGGGVGWHIHQVHHRDQELKDNEYLTESDRQHLSEKNDQRASGNSAGQSSDDQDSGNEHAYTSVFDHPADAGVDDGHRDMEEHRSSKSK